MLGGAPLQCKEQSGNMAATAVDVKFPNAVVGLNGYIANSATADGVKRFPDFQFFD
jgi:hypothetical protein